MLGTVYRVQIVVPCFLWPLEIGPGNKNRAPTRAPKSIDPVGFSSHGQRHGLTGQELCVAAPSSLVRIWRGDQVLAEARLPEARRWGRGGGLATTSPWKPKRQARNQKSKRSKGSVQRGWPKWGWHQKIKLWLQDVQRGWPNEWWWLGERSRGPQQGFRVALHGSLSGCNGANTRFVLYCECPSMRFCFVVLCVCGVLPNEAGNKAFSFSPMSGSCAERAPHLPEAFLLACQAFVHRNSLCLSKARATLNARSGVNATLNV